MDTDKFDKEQSHLDLEPMIFTVTADTLTNDSMIWSSTALDNMSSTITIPSVGTPITLGDIPSINLSKEIEGTQLVLRGSNADVLINGVSLNQTLQQLQQRLNLLQTNTDLEQEWDQLRQLGEQYRALEKQCEEKSAAWKQLQSMPPPQLD